MGCRIKKLIKEFAFSGQMSTRLQAAGSSEVKNRKEKAVNKCPPQEKNSSLKGCDSMLLLFWECTGAEPVP